MYDYNQLDSDTLLILLSRELGVSTESIFEFALNHPSKVDEAYEWYWKMGRVPKHVRVQVIKILRGEIPFVDSNGAVLIA